MNLIHFSANIYYLLSLLVFVSSVSLMKGDRQRNGFLAGILFALWAIYFK